MPVAPLTVAARRAGRLVAVAVLCIYLTTAGGSLTSVDAVMTYEVTKSLVTHGTASFDRPGINNHPGVDGRYYSPFGIGQSLFNIPFYAASRAASEALGIRLGRADMLEKAGVALGSAVAAAGAVWVVFLFAWRLGGRIDAAALTAFACAFGTLLWPYSTFGFNQALTAWCLTGGVYAAWAGVRLDRPGLVSWGGVWLACAFLTRHEMGLAAAVVAGWMAVESRGEPGALTRRLVRLGVPLLAAFVFWCWYNDVRFGSPFETGNLGPVDAADDQHFSVGVATLTGMWGLLFSPGRSLFLYVPLAIAAFAAVPALARRDRSLAWLVVASFAALLTLYGSLRYWDGLRGYGPRYLVPLLPLVTVPLVTWLGPGRSRTAVLGFALLSATVQLPGVLVDFSKVSVEHARRVGEYSRDAKIYSWSESAIALDTAAALEAVPGNLRNLARGVRPPLPDTAADDGAFAQRLAFSLDFWWLYLYYLAVVPAWGAILLGVLPLLAAAVALVRLRREWERARHGTKEAPPGFSGAGA